MNATVLKFPTPFTPGDRVYCARREQRGTVMRVYSDGACCVLWDTGCGGHSESLVKQRELERFE